MNIVITGGSKGMGKAIARHFSGKATTIFICARNAAELEATAQELNRGQATVRPFAADLSVKEEVLRFSSWVLAQGTPDILVNNAGSFLPGSIYNEEEGTLEKMMAANLFSAYHLTRALLPSMMEKRAGHIFNMCSIASLHAYANGGAYSISKYALAGFSKNLREEMKPYSIKVTAVYPGAVYTSSWEGSGVPPERMMNADDVAAMIYAASQLSPAACVEDIILRPLPGDIP